MKQQPLLTADKALGLVCKIAPEYTWDMVVNLIVGRDYDLGEIEKYLDPEMDIVVCAHLSEDSNRCFISPNFVEVAKDCASRLRSQGYYVFLRLEIDDDDVTLYRCDFVVGECARLLDRIYSLSNYLNDLKEFVEKNKHELPPNFVAEQKTINEYLGCLLGKYEVLLELYTDNWETGLKEECKKAWKLVNEVEAYLERIKDLRRLHAISLILE
jgi:uncharacterized protein YuzB (UPF0349 family)